MYFKKIIILIFLIITLPACATCNIPKGSYTSFGGSEEFTQLRLNDDYTFKIKYETWSPSDYKNRSTSEFDGVFKCKGKLLSLVDGELSEKAQATKVGENPLGIPSNIDAIKFDEILSTKYKFLEKEILYFELRN